MRIAISGAGVAGPTLAYWLERTGHEPTLIEQAPELRTGGYVIDFWGVGYAIAERMGLMPAIREAGYKVREVRLVDRDGNKVGGFSSDVFRRFTDDRFISLPRGDLAAAIHASVPDKVETMFGDSISAVEQHDDGVRLAFEHARPRDFDLLVGADGLHSRVRKLVFGPQDRFEKRLGYRVAAFRAEGYRPRDELVYVSYAAPGLQAARFALSGDRTLFLLIMTEDHLKGAEPDDLASRKRLLKQAFAGAGWECDAILRELDGTDELYFDRVSQIRMDRWHEGRTVLIGDAAACASLLAGEGTGLAMTEAYILAGELHRAAGDYRTAFAEHDRLLRPFIEGKQRSAESFAASFAPKTQFGITVRNLVTRAMTLPGVAHFFIGRDIRDDIDLPRYDM